MTSTHTGSRRRDALAGATVGTCVGFALVYVPVVGAVLFIAFAIPAAIGRALAAIAGLLVGSGGVILTVIGLANANCTGLSGGSGDGCVPPDLTGWLIAGGAMLSIGIALMLETVRRSRRVAP